MQRALAFAPASAAEKLRATQKDAVYCNELFEQAHGTLSGLIGAERAQSWLPELQAAVALAYYGLTAGLGAPTPGEEYCDIARVRARVGLPASIARRLLCVLLCALLPLAYSHAHRRLVAAARASDEETEDWRTLALRFVAAKLERIRAAFDRLRLAFFYLGSRHLDLALPMAGIAQARAAARRSRAMPAPPHAAVGAWRRCGYPQRRLPRATMPRWAPSACSSWPCPPRACCAPSCAPIARAAPSSSAGVLPPPRRTASGVLIAPAPRAQQHGPLAGRPAGRRVARRWYARQTCTPGVRALPRAQAAPDGDAVRPHLLLAVRA